MSRRTRWAAVCALAVAAVLIPAAEAQIAPSGADYQIIVNARNPTPPIDRAFVAQAFLKKIRKWPDGATIQPVDLVPSSPARQRYSTQVLGRSIDAVKSYWQQMIFSGRELPPPELPSDVDVVTFVTRNPGAIGYVLAGTELRGAKVLTIR